MVKAAPASSFIVAQAEFLLQFLVITLDDPALAKRTRSASGVLTGRVDNQLCLSKTSKCMNGRELYFLHNSLLRCSFL
jgi:hypothetical protein